MTDTTTTPSAKVAGPGASTPDPVFDRLISDAYHGLSSIGHLSDIAYRALPNTTDEDEARALLEGISALTHELMGKLQREDERRGGGLLQ